MPENDYRVEDKALFVRRINEALIECGGGRYDYLHATPMEYVEEGFREYVTLRDERVSVFMDSLPAMLFDIRALF